MSSALIYTNSPFVSYVKLSPNCTQNRNHVIDTITIHCVSGNCSIETIGEIFSNPKRKSSSNYGIGSDGRIGMYVEEKDRSWCSSNSKNDNRAVTIEVANITGSPNYNISSAAYTSLINLCVDICRRNNIKKLLWMNDKKLIGNIEKQNMTVHKWFANKACPGLWLYDNMGIIANTVNQFLAAPTSIPKADTVVSEESNEERLWKFLDGKELTDIAKAGLMANIFAESGFHSNNLQNSYEKKFGMNDDAYTAAVDNGSYTNFVKDKAGYGLAQWTYWTRKDALYKYIKSKGKSISDFDSQCEYLYLELSKSYKGVLTKLQAAKTIREASDIVLLEYEKPADKSNTIKLRRYQYGLDIYNKYVDAAKNDLPYTVRITATGLRVRKGPGTDNAIIATNLKPGVYTIVEESTGKGAKLWGKLKSGTGWISLDYCKRI